MPMQYHPKINMNYNKMILCYIQSKTIYIECPYTLNLKLFRLNAHIHSIVISTTFNLFDHSPATQLIICEFVNSEILKCCLIICLLLRHLHEFISIICLSNITLPPIFHSPLFFNKLENPFDIIIDLNSLI